MRLLIFLLLSIISTRGLCQQVDSNFINLLSDPEKHHGKEIEVVGYINFEFEGDYISPEINSRQEVWIAELADSLLVKKYFRKLKGRRVRIVGFYDKNKLGHMSMFRGTITNITKLEEYND
jgi:hypothetical protein